jgi:hypothetical protein
MKKENFPVKVFVYGTLKREGRGPAEDYPSGLQTRRRP